MEAELAGLEDEWAEEEAKEAAALGKTTMTTTPSYLAQDLNLPTAPMNTHVGPRRESAEAAVDQYGLPMAPIVLH